jgi:hypothetical protein
MSARLKTLQGHSGALMLVLHHYLKFSDKPNFDLRMTEPRSKVYRITFEGMIDGAYVFRTGKDWPCYSKIYPSTDNTEFRIRHDHSSAQEEFKMENRRLYSGRLVTEGGLEVRFDGDFYQPTTLKLTEDYRLSDGLHTSDRRYEVDRCW